MLCAKEWEVLRCGKGLSFRGACRILKEDFTHEVAFELTPHLSILFHF